MFRFTKMHKWYGIEIESVEADLANIEEFASSNTVVMIIEDVEAFQNVTGLEEDEFEVV